MNRAQTLADIHAAHNDLRLAVYWIEHNYGPSEELQAAYCILQFANAALLRIITAPRDPTAQQCAA